MKLTALAALALAAALLGGAARTAPAPARQAVDMELVLATDVSPSIDESEAHLQREGIAEAFLNPQVVQAIRAGSLGRIAVAYVEFPSRDYDRVVIDWRVIHDQDTATAFAQAVRAAPPTFGRHTSISDAIELGEVLLDTNRFDGTRRVIDISGDGPNNWGRDLVTVRDGAVKRGIVINGLPILSDDNQFGFGSIPDLDKYYADCVIGGPGAFIVPAKGFGDFARAMRNKLVTEIAGLSPSSDVAGMIAVQFQPRSRLAPQPPTSRCHSRFGF